MDRREFLRRIGATGVVIAGSTAGALLLHNRSARNQTDDRKLKDYRVEVRASASELVIVHGSTKDQMVQAAIGEMGGMETFITRGDVVVIKPNVAFDRPPELGATTSPDILKAVIQQCKRAGANRIRVADNPINQPESCFYKSGIKRVADETGAELVYPYASEFEQLYIGGETLTSTWPMFYGPFRDADKVIGLAPLKDHNLCHASMSMKNWYGLLSGSRNRFHQDIHGVISDFPHMIKPTLVILDATRILTRNGPTGGNLNDVAEANTIVVGVDMVAVDSYGYELLRKIRGNGPDALEYVEKAHARGLGNRDWRSLRWREVSV